MTKFLKSGNTFRVMHDNSLDVRPELPAGTYSVKFDQMKGEFFLEGVNQMTLPTKMYGDVQKKAERILKAFEDRSGSTGVLLSGEKGSGKTLLAKVLSVFGFEKGYPTILVSEPFSGSQFNEFIQNISQPTIVIIDEFEKTYDPEQQESLLTLFDGVYRSKKLFIVTCNELARVDRHMRNRPGRLYYALDYRGVSPELISEFCQDNLKNTSHIEKMVRLSVLFDSFNMDMLQAMVEEMNRFDEDPFEVMQMLNIDPETGRTQYDFKLLYEEKPIHHMFVYQADNNGTLKLNPLGEFVLDVEIEGEGEHHLHLTFGPKDLMKVDGDRGLFIFEKPDIRLELTKSQAIDVNWRQLF